MLPTLPALPPRPDISAPAMPDAGGAAAAEPSTPGPFARELRKAESKPSETPEPPERQAARMRARNEGGPRERTSVPGKGSRETRDTPPHNSVDQSADKAAEEPKVKNQQDSPAADPHDAVDRSNRAAPDETLSTPSTGMTDRARPLGGDPVIVAETVPTPQAAAAPDPRTLDLAAARLTLSPASTDAPVGDGVGAPTSRSAQPAFRGLSLRHAMTADSSSNAAARSESGPAVDAQAATARAITFQGHLAPGQPSEPADALEAARAGLRAATGDGPPNGQTLAAASTSLADRMTVALQSPLTAAAATGTTAQAQLGAPVGSAEFAPALGGQLAVWLREGVQEAQLQLHPAELGPVAVQIALDGTQAQVDFHAAHARTRDAIEASLPTLAAALRDAGFTLAGGGVFGQGAGESGARHTARTLRGDARERADTATAIDTEAMRRAPPGGHWRRGLLDVFA